jgi:hypothetical protein
LDPHTGAASFSANLGQFDHFASPSAAGGRLFVANGSQVTAFTIASPPPPSPTSTTLSSSVSRPRRGQRLILLASVAPAPDAGTVAFFDGAKAIPGCGAVALVPAIGLASCPVSFAAAGRHPLTATFSGDSYYRRSRSKMLAQVVRPNPPTLSRIRVAARGSSIALTLTLSEHAKLIVAITQKVHGRTINGRCVRRARTGARCTVAARKASRTLTGVRGRHTYRILLNGLANGRYTLELSARTPSGGRSTLHRFAFTLHVRSTHG